jgi:hypothetical protein
MLNVKKKFNCNDIHITLPAIILTYSNDKYQ